MSDAEDDFFGLLHEAEAAGPPLEEDPLADASAMVRAQCEGWLQQAFALRFDPDRWPPSSAPPNDVKDALVQVRASLDQLETLLANVMMLKAGSAAGATQAENAADDAWDRQAEAERHRPRPEYQGSRERYAYWNLAIRAERARARDARDLANYVRGAADVIKLVHDGLNETRRDLAARLTHARWEIHMEQ